MPFFCASCTSYSYIILKWVGRYVSLNANIYITADPTPVNAVHVAHACRCIGALNVHSVNHHDPHTSTVRFDTMILSVHSLMMVKHFLLICQLKTNP